MKPGEKVTCVNNGPINFTDSEGDQEVLEAQPSLVVGKEYTVEKFIPATDFFAFDRVTLVEEKGQSFARYSAQRFK